HDRSLRDAALPREAAAQAMDRVLATFLLALVAGCSSSAPTRLVAGAAIFGGASSDQAWVAVLTRTRRLETGAHVGALEVVPTRGGTPLVLDDASNGGLWNRGTTLWYQGGVTVVSEGTPPSD